jgi:SAM-dependent methyltransferase
MGGEAFACWLALREAVDDAARSTELLERVRRLVGEDRSAVIHDLGCGTGSVGRWLAPRLSSSQHWVLHDRDADLLRRASADFPREAGGGAAITFEFRHSDITRLGVDGEGTGLSGATLVTASALLDLLTSEGLERLVAACASTAAPVLITLSVTGVVDLIPGDPLDGTIAEAFNEHQRRSTAAGRLLGPDAFQAAVEAFRRTGAEVLVQPSPWRLDASHAGLAARWLAGWVDAAGAVRPELRAAAGSYIRRRLAALHAGDLGVTVHHADLLAVPS